MFNKLFLIPIIILIPLIYVFVIKTDKDVREPKSSQLIRECPDSWIVNRMPGGPEESNKGKQYFIIDGKRQEIDEYNLTWIRENCDIEPKIVY